MTSDTIYRGDLVIRPLVDAAKYRGITKVTGHLYIDSGGRLDAPALTSVGGHLSIHSSGKPFVASKQWLLSYLSACRIIASMES